MGRAWRRDPVSSCDGPIASSLLLRDGIGAGIRESTTFLAERIPTGHLGEPAKILVQGQNLVHPVLERQRDEMRVVGQVAAHR